ncbi:hypothetical protein [Mucilaginibacter sp. HD30]
MKKLVVSLSLILALAACKLPSYTIGMSETEFKSKHKWTAQVSEQTADHTVYKVQISLQDEKRKRYQYFYFENGKLVRLDEGQAMLGI